MNKILKYALAAASLLVFSTACNHDPDEIVMSSTNPVISKHGDVVVNDLTVNEDFTLAWSPAKFGENTAVTYTVSAKTAGEFEQLTVTDACSFSCTNAELFEIFGINVQGKYDVTFRVVARAATGEEKEAAQVVVHFDYAKITYLWAFGDYQQWKLNGEGPVSRLLQGTDGVFRGFVQLTSTEKSQIKFASQSNWEGTSYGPGATEGTMSSKDAPNFTMDPGLYYWEVDVANMTYVAIPLTSVSLIGEAVGGWNDGDDVEMSYDAAAQTWVAIANIVSGKSYKVRFNKAWNIAVGDKEYDCSLGAPVDAMTIKGSVNLSAEGEGITSFTLSLFDYPYTIKEGTVKEDEKSLYIANSTNGWNYFESSKMLPLYNEDNQFLNMFCGLMQLPAAGGEYLFSRLQSVLGTRYGKAADATGSAGEGVNVLTSYAGGAAATGLTSTGGLSYVYVDLNEGVMCSVAVPITSVGIVGAVNSWNEKAPLELTYDAASMSWKGTVTFAADGEFKLLFNKMWNTEVNDMTLQLTMGGSCGDLQIGGGNIFMTAGEHDFELNLSKSPFTLSTDGQVVDLSANPDYLELTGAFANYNWNQGIASPALNPYKEDGRYAGFVDMYKPAAAEGTECEFKVTYPGWSVWLGGAPQSEGATAYNIDAANGDNMKIGYGIYFWDVALNAQEKNGVATAIPMQSVGLIGTVNGSVWSQDYAMTAAGEGLYTLDATIESAFKVRLHEANYTDDTAWKYNLGLTTKGALAEGVETALVPDGGENLEVSAAGDYTVTLNLAKSPNTIKIVKK